MTIILIIYLFIGTFLMMGTAALCGDRFYRKHLVSAWRIIPFTTAFLLLAVLLFWPAFLLWPERK